MEIRSMDLDPRSMHPHHGVVVEQRVAVDVRRDERDGHGAGRRDVPEALPQCVRVAQTREERRLGRHHGPDREGGSTPSIPSTPLHTPPHSFALLHTWGGIVAQTE